MSAAAGRRALAALLGALAVAGYAPLAVFPLPLLALAALMLLWLRAPTTRDAAVLGWWYGLGFFLTGVSWVYVSLHTFGAMPAPVAGLVTLLFCGFLALFPAAAGYVVRRVPLGAIGKLLLVGPATWTLLEALRGVIFTGFPWLELGYAQIPASPLAGYAPVLGIAGVTLASALTAGALVLALIAKSRGAVAGLLVVWAAGYGLQQVRWTEPVGKPLTVSLLQGNIAQDLKWRPEVVARTLATYLDLVRGAEGRLIVLPETALPLFLEDVPRDYLEALARHAAQRDGDVLIGLPEGSPRDGYYNSIISVGAAPAQVYRKWHLVPFGEFIPLRPLLGPIVGALAIPLQDFSRGSATPRPLAVAGQQVAVNICYEDVFGEEIIRQLPAATLLVNASNVAWFGRSIAPYQHLQISQARALETGRYMLRATNTGMTAVIDPRGRVAALAPEFTLATLTHTVQGHRGATPYVRFGATPVLALCMLLLLAGLAASRRQ